MPPDTIVNPGQTKEPVETAGWVENIAKYNTRLYVKSLTDVITSYCDTFWFENSKKK